MPNQRSADQRGILLYVRESFLEKIDSAIPRCGYSDRSSFIRDAVFEKLERMGIKLSPIEKSAPDRKGKGGAKKKKSDSLRDRKNAAFGEIEAKAKKNKAG